MVYENKSRYDIKSKQNVDLFSGAPDMTISPVLPGLPVLLDLPGLPVLLDLPDLPVLLEVPGLPVLLEVPGLPVLLEVPGLPVLLEVPGLPVLLEVPGLPVLLEVPGLPVLLDSSGLPVLLERPDVLQMHFFMRAKKHRILPVTPAPRAGVLGRAVSTSSTLPSSLSSLEDVSGYTGVVPDDAGR